MQKPYYVYSHWAVGKDSPFYVGMSTKRQNGLTYARAYRNAFSSKDNEWARYARLVPYYVKIEKEFYNIKDAHKYEVQLIKTWGRKDLNKGPLLNLTDGGVGVINATNVTLKKMINSRVKNNPNLKIGQTPYFIETHKYSVMGVYISSYESATEAARKNGSLPTDILSALKGTKIVVAGFQWRTYKDEKGIGLPRQRRLAEKPILQINFKTKEVIKRFESAVKASKETGISRSGIANVLVGISKTSGGYLWEYE